MRSRHLYLILACIALAAAAFLAWQHPWNRIEARTPAEIADAIERQNAAASSTVPTTIALSDDSRLYRNAAFHFSIAFPATLAPREYEESGGAMSVTFEDPGAPHEFQIYATPYADTQITPARFKLDEPSGVRKDPMDVMIDGIRATMFFSANPSMGETREVWFIRDGFLYEVVTEKSNDAWLAGIMQSWKFI